MVKKFNASQFKAEIKRAQRKAEQDFKREVQKAQREAEQKIKRETSKMARSIESKINRELRSINLQNRRNQQIIVREYGKLQTRSVVHTQYSASLNTMRQSYLAASDVYQTGDLTSDQEELLFLVEQEYANGLVTANTLETDDPLEENTEDIEIGDKLAMISADLDNRWKGAVYALNPSNPDASRHFCTSAREIFTEFIEMKAPDKAVFAFNPNCEKTDRGNATRRAKIGYMMRNRGMEPSVINFADADITNILELFHVLSDGTHGAAGRYSYDKLLQVKRRVEQGINFLYEIST